MADTANMLPTVSPTQSSDRLGDQIESSPDVTTTDLSFGGHRLNVLLFIDDLTNPLAGTEQHLQFLLSHLPQPPLRITFAIFSGFDSGSQCQFAIAPILLNCRTVRWPLGALQKLHRLAALIAREQIDVVHTFCPMSEMLATAATRLARQGRVLGVRRNIGYWHSHWSLWRTRLSTKLHIDLVANCEAARQFAIEHEWVSADRISVIRNPVNTDRRDVGLRTAFTRASLGLSDVQPVVGIVANVRPVKDYTTFLRAAHIVRQRFPSTHFVVVGSGEPGYLAQMRGLADKLNLDSHLTWLGAVENPFSILPVFDVAVLSSQSEGFSNTLLEYAACGIPSVATDVGGTREIVVDGETGFVVPPAAPEALADRICHFLASPDLRRTFGQCARQRAERTYAERDAIRQYIELYGRIAKSAQPKAEAIALALVFHGVIDERHKSCGSSDSAAARYAVTLQNLQLILNQLDPTTTCTASNLRHKQAGKLTVLTFDDGLASDYILAFPALQERKLKATFFVNANNVGRRGYTNARQLREMADAGMEIASHGLNHDYLVSMSRHAATAEIRDSKARLEDLLGHRVTAFAPVGGHYERRMIHEAEKAGFGVFATMIPGESRPGPDMVLLKRNHLQAQHSVGYAARLLAGDRRLLWPLRVRYEVLRLPKRVLGMATYDRLRGAILRQRSDGSLETAEPEESSAS